MNIAPNAQGENTSHSSENASSIGLMLGLSMFSSFDLSISEIKTLAPSLARCSARCIPTLPAPWIEIFLSVNGCEKQKSIASFIT